MTPKPGAKRVGYGVMAGCATASTGRVLVKEIVLKAVLASQRGK